jgi:hypothetical protein
MTPFTINVPLLFFILWRNLLHLYFPPGLITFVKLFSQWEKHVQFECKTIYMNIKVFCISPVRLALQKQFWERSWYLGFPLFWFEDNVAGPHVSACSDSSRPGSKWLLQNTPYLQGARSVELQPKFHFLPTCLTPFLSCPPSTFSPYLLYHVCHLGPPNSLWSLCFFEWGPYVGNGK